MRDSSDEVTRFHQAGAWSLVFCGGLGLAIAMIAYVFRAPVALAGTAIALGCGVLLWKLTIEVDDAGVTWFFTCGLFKKRVEFEKLGACAPAGVVPIGLGYRIGVNRQAWLVTGGGAVVLKRRDSAMQYVVGSSDPSAVCAEIELRRKRANR